MLMLISEMLFVTCFSDTKLDWYGAQVGQGTYNGIPAAGSPAVWTTTDPNHPGFQPDNR